MKERSLRSLSVCVAIAAAMLLSIPVGSMMGGVGSVRAQPTVLIVGITESVDSLNPFGGYLTSSYQMFSMMYDLLVAVDGDLNPAPGLAESWSHSADGTVWTYNIRHGMTWHDGVPVTAEDVNWTYNLILSNPSAGSLYVDQLSNVTDVRALDDYTLRITTEVPKATMLSIIVPIVPKHLWMKISPRMITSVNVFDTRYFPDGPIGSGPFRLMEYATDDFVRFTKNANYWGGAASFDDLVYKIFLSPATMLNALHAGTIDIAVGVPPDSWDATLAEPSIDGQAVRELTMVELGMNVCPVNLRLRGASTNYETLNLSVRQAIAMAINKTQIVQDVLRGQAIEGSTLIPPASVRWHYNITPEEEYKFNFNAANATLDAANYKDTDGDGIRENGTSGKPLSFRFNYIIENPEDQTAAYMIERWLRIIGIDAPAVGVREDTMIKYWIGMEYDMYIWGWGGDADPSFLLSVMTTDQIPTSRTDWSAWSDCYYSNPYYDELFVRQQTTIDIAARQRIVFEMQQILYRDSPYVVLYYPYGLYAYRTDRFTNWPDMVSHPGKSPFATWTGGPWMYLEIRPIGETPTARFTVTPPEGNISTVFVFDASSSYDAEDPVNLLAVRWDWEDDGVWDTDWSVEKVASHQYGSTGTYTVRLAVMDTDSNQDETTRTVIVLNSPPMAFFTVDPEWGDKSTVFTFDASLSSDLEDPLASLQVRWDFDGNDVWDTAWSTSKIAQYQYAAVGTYAPRLEVKDSLSLVSSVIRVVEVLDVGAPVTRVALTGKAGSNGWYVSFVVVTLTAQDEDTGVASTHYRIDSGYWEDYSSPFAISTDGDHVLDYYSVDDAGNTETTKTTHVRIDRVAPVTSMVISGTAGAKGWYTSPVNVTLSTASDLSGVNRTFYKLGSGDWVLYAGKFMISTDGIVQLQVRSQDIAGNMEGAKLIDLKIDCAPPVISYSGPTSFDTSTVTISWTQSDAVSGIDRVETSLDGAAFVDRGTTSTVSLVDLSDGTHTLVIRVVDAAGNVAETTVTFEVDTGDGAASTVVYMAVAAAVIVAASAAAVLVSKKRKRLSPPKDQT